MSDVAKALALALPKIANPGKDGKSHHGKYATLAAILDHVRPVLAEHGLAVMQPIEAEGVRTMIVHESGGVYDAGTYPVGAFANPQAQGSAISYARRYSLMSVLGIAGADDDGNAAVRATQAPQREPREPRLVSAAQMKALQASMRDMDRDARLELVRQVIGRDIESSKELTSQEAAKVLNHVKGGDDGVDANV